MPYKNSSLIVVKLLSNQDSAPDVIQECSKQNTASNPLLSGISNSDADMKTAVELLQKLYTGSKQKPALYLEADVNAQKIIVVKMYNENAGDIQKVARQQVIDTGDINNGIKLIDNSGYRYKKPRTPSTKTFKVTNNGPNSFLITTKSAGTGATYLHDWGTTPTKGVPPLQQNKAEMLVSHEHSSTVNDLITGTIYAFREAIIVPIPRKKTAPSITSTSKLATPTVSGKAHRAYFSATAPSHYQWSDWQYAIAT